MVEALHEAVEALQQARIAVQPFPEVGQDLTEIANDQERRGVFRSGQTVQRVQETMSRAGFRWDETDRRFVEEVEEGRPTYQEVRDATWSRTTATSMWRLEAEEVLTVTAGPRAASRALLQLAAKHGFRWSSSKRTFIPRADRVLLSPPVLVPVFLVAAVLAIVVTPIGAALTAAASLGAILLVVIRLER